MFDLLSPIPTHE
jgi:kinesin family member 6/9